MPDRRHYMRPIAELRTEAQVLADRIAELRPETTSTVVDAAAVELTGELLDELESWRALLGQQLTIEPCGIASVMVGPEGQVRLQVERKPLRDGGVPAEGMAAAYEATAAERRERLAEAEQALADLNSAVWRDHPQWALTSPETARAAEISGS